MQVKIERAQARQYSFKVIAHLERLECTNFGDSLDRLEEDEHKHRLNLREVSESEDESPRKRSRSSHTPKKKRLTKLRFPEVLRQSALDTVGDYIRAAAPPSRFPPKHYCLVSHLPAKCKSSQFGMYYNSVGMLENPPYWVKKSGSIAPYHQAIGQLRGELQDF